MKSFEEYAEERYRNSIYKDPNVLEDYLEGLATEIRFRSLNGQTEILIIESVRSELNSLKMNGLIRDFDLYSDNTGTVNIRIAPNLSVSHIGIGIRLETGK